MAEYDLTDEDIITEINKLDAKINDVNDKIDKLHKVITNKIDPLVELLQVIVNSNLKDISPVVIENKPIEDSDLYYKIDDNYICIRGKKTYSNKDIIKSNFNANWNKEKMAWSFLIFDGCEEKLKEFFPDITKDQS